MDEAKIRNKGPAGGKTVGTVGGVLTLALSHSLPESSPLKPVIAYAAPVVAVFFNDWGGACVYQIKIWAITEWQHWKLRDVKKRIDNIPDHPEFDQVKKDVNKAYFKVSADIILVNLESVRRLSKLVEEKDPKYVADISASDKESKG